MNTKPKMFSIKNINTSPDGIQPRDSLNQETVEQYAAIYKAGEESFPAVYLWDIPGHGVRISDGYHRVNAAQAAGKKTILAIISIGSMADCVKDAIFRNACHGLPLSVKEKQFALYRILEEHRREGRNPGSTKDLAHTCGLNVATVRSWIKTWNQGKDEADQHVPPTEELEKDPNRSSILDEPDWRDRDDIPEERKNQLEAEHERTEMLVKIHDAKQDATGLRRKLTEVEYMWNRLLNNGMGEFYLENDESFRKLLDFTKKCSFACTPQEVCSFCDGFKCDRCGQRGWIPRGAQST